MRWRIPGDESPLAESPKRYPPRVRLATRPPALHGVRQNRSANGAAEMVLPFAPIDTGTTKRALLEFERVDFDPMLSQEVPPLLRQMNQRATPAQQPMDDPLREEVNGQAPREVVIARAGIAHGFIFGTGPSAHMPNPCRDRNQCLDRLGHVRIGDTKIAVTTLLGAGEEARRLEFLEVPGGGGGRHASLARQLGG